MYKSYRETFEKGFIVNLAAIFQGMVYYTLMEVYIMYYGE